MRTPVLAVVVSGLQLLAVAAGAQVIEDADFENDDADGWTIQNVAIVSPINGNPGGYLTIPTIKAFGLNIAARASDNPGITGDLTRYGSGGLRLEFDFRTIVFDTLTNGPADPATRPVVLQFMDILDVNDPARDVSVFVVGRTMPQIQEGWVRFSYDIPDPTKDALPAGWGGTGDQDVIDPRLPAGRTYRNVMESIDEIRLTTFVPGFVYGARVWEIGVDNVRVTVVPAPGAAGVLAGACLAAVTRRRR